MDTVLEAAAQVFEREGLGATTNRIAERAGFSIGTLYQYFPNKHALLAALAERHLDDARDLLRDTVADLDRRKPGWEETVRTVATALVTLHADRPRLHALLYDHAPRLPEGVRRLRDLHTELTAGVTAHLSRCGHADRDAEQTAALLVHAGEATLHRVLLAGDPASDDPAQHAETLTRTLLAISSPRAGREAPA